MDIREIRIGDIVTTNGKPMGTKEGDYYQVIEIDSEEVYINDDDDYIHNTHCVYWMPIPSLSKELK